jgi:hypothetical protein
MTRAIAALAVAGGLATPVAGEAKSCDLRYLEPNITSLHATGRGVVLVRQFARRSE